jgi:hypothetical protein
MLLLSTGESIRKGMSAAPATRDGLASSPSGEGMVRVYVCMHMDGRLLQHQSSSLFRPGIITPPETLFPVAMAACRPSARLKSHTHTVPSHQVLVVPIAAAVVVRSANKCCSRFGESEIEKSSPLLFLSCLSSHLHDSLCVHPPSQSAPPFACRDQSLGVGRWVTKK